MVVRTGRWGSSLKAPGRTWVPKSRYRIYGGVSNYLRFGLDFLRWRHRSDGEVGALEEALAARWSSPHVVLVPMARVGLYLLFRYFSRRGSVLLMSPYTIVDVVNMVLAAGLRPRFVDVDPDTGNLTPEALETADFSDVAAVLVTHLHGVPADIERIAAICERRGVPWLEDAAQCMGAGVSERPIGTFGMAGVFSWGSYKNVNSWFGGVVLTRDPELAGWIRSERAAWPLFESRHLLRKVRESASTDLLASWPLFGVLLFPVFRKAWLNGWERINRMLRIELDTAARPSLPAYYRGRFTDLQVASARAQLPRVEADTRIRIQFAEEYYRGLSGLSGLRLPPAPNRERNVYTYFAILEERRDDLLCWLQHFGRDVAPQHLHNVAELPDFRLFGEECPVASRVARSVVLLPTYPSYGIDQVRANIAIIRWYVLAGRPRYRATQGETR